MHNQFLPKNINGDNPNYVNGDLTVSGIINGRLEIPISARITVLSNTNYDVLYTDRILLISTTGAGTFNINLGNLGTNLFQLTIFMTAQNTGTYDINGIASGVVSLSAANTSVTVVHLGNGVWTGVYGVL